MGSELTDSWRAKYPGAYDNVPDDQLEKAIVAKFPGAYDHHVDSSVKSTDTKSSDPTDKSNWDLRPDGTKKGNGFLGVLKRPDGKVMSEYSIADSEKIKDAKGNYLDYPTLVPGLSQDEINTLLKSNPGDVISQSIKDKAEAHALERIRQGKSVFADNNESTNNISDKPNKLSELWNKVTNDPTVKKLLTGTNDAESQLMKDKGITNIQGHGLMTIPGLDKLGETIKNKGINSGDYWKGFAGSISKDLIDMVSSGFDPRASGIKSSPNDLFPVEHNFNPNELTDIKAKTPEIAQRAMEHPASPPNNNPSYLMKNDINPNEAALAEDTIGKQIAAHRANELDKVRGSVSDIPDNDIARQLESERTNSQPLSEDEVNKLFTNTKPSNNEFNFGQTDKPKINIDGPKITSLKPATPELIAQAQKTGPDVIHLKTADKTQLGNAAEYGYQFEGINSDGSLRLRKNAINISSNDIPSNSDGFGGGNSGDEPPKEFLFQNNQPKPFLEALKDASKTPFKSTIDLTKSLVTAGHFSAPFRQGAMLLSHPSDWANAVGKMFQGAMSEDRMNLINQKITEMPSHQWAKKSGVAFTNLGDAPTLREDAIRSRLAESIPGYGKFVRLGNRAFNTFTNALRANVAETLYNDAKDAAKNLTGEDLIKANPDTNLNLSKQLAGFVNAGSGRGSLGSLEKYADGLNTIMFSPRLQASRLEIIKNILSPNTVPQVRKESIKSLLALASLGMTVNGLAKFGGGQTSLDPTSADFGKARIGNVRIDPWEGYQQYAVLASRLLSGKYTSSTTGKTSSLGLFGKPTGMNMLEDFAANKTTPPLKFAYDMLNAKNIHGQSSFSIGSEMASQIAPIIAQQVYEVAKENPELLPLTIPAGSIGLGVSAYGTK